MAEPTGTKKVCVALPLDTVDMLHTLSGVSNCTQAELITLALKVFEMGQQAQAQGGGLILTNKEGQAQTQIRLPYSQPFAVMPVGTVAVDVPGQATKL